ncbi:PEP-CTERM sorting domain-containing protein [Thalassomonas haliotis]|uniref:PEP-CTERM sorting domain-containing protein n=1 Tax=Thalassomonas haliotis TaxID=485448 RepID=A0ABY7VM92_9GAMM|nr:PEP-CTERM sorting domain-containing protein [Thalassomonas haliotis]WDE13767.1 PEP-CTERM sorting domain-containing protein [Thalassomonas haliotis]
MKKIMKFIVLVLSFNLWLNLAWACGHPPPPPPVPDPPPPQVWMIDHGIDPATGMSNMWFGVEIDPELFPITEPTVCTCGIGLGGADLPFVPSLSVTSAMLAVTNMETHDIERLDGFDFTPDSAIAGDSAANALLPDQQWHGFSALVENFVQPILEDNEVLKLWFNLEVHPDDIEALHGATSGQMLGFSIGGAPDDPQHQPQQFVAKKVPEPASALLLTLGLVLFTSGRRKRLAP